MQAYLIDEHGGPEVYRLAADFAVPDCSDDEVVVRVRATSLNFHDVFTRTGMPGIKVPFPIIAGLDIAGDVYRTGPGADGWSEGDRVLVDPVDRVRGGLMGETKHGGLAQYCVVHKSQLHRLPDAVAYEDAAALPVAYGTAFRMLNARGQLTEGERVLVLGAAGGVGTAAVMLAKRAGAEVTACASTARKLEALKDLGADHVINYAETDLMKAAWAIHGKPTRTGTSGYDVVVNFTGGDTWVPSLRCLRKNGRLLTCGATAGFDPQTDLRFIWTFELNIVGSNGMQPEDLDSLIQMVASGTLAPAIHDVLPLAETGDGIRLLEDRHVIGKIVIDPWS